MAVRGANLCRVTVSALAVATAIVHASPACADEQGAVSAAANLAAATQGRTITMSVPVSLGPRTFGDVVIQIAPDGSVAIESQSFRREMAGILNDAGVQRLDQIMGGKPFVSPDELATGGVTVRFDSAQLQLVIDAIDPGLRPIQSIGGQAENSDELLPSIEPEPFSAYLNTSFNLAYREGQGVVPPDVFLFGAARYRGFVVEFDGGFSEDFDGDYGFFRRGVRAVYDEPGSYRRWSAGDLRLESRSVVRQPFLAGVAVEKSRRIFDPFAPVTNFGGRQILIDTPSTVQVLVNGAPYQTLELQPGTYNLDDLPVQFGSNDIQLVVRDAAGREQVTRFGYFYDPIELSPGDNEYLVALGVVANELSLGPSYSNDPALVANYRKALSDILVLGGGVQLSEDVQVIAAETQIVPQAIPGSFDLQGAMSFGEGTGISLRASYRYASGAGANSRRFVATVGYENRNFRTVGDLSDFRIDRLTASATYTHAFSLRTFAVAGATLLARSGGRDQTTVFIDINHQLRDNIRGTIGFEYASGTSFGSSFGVRASISVLFGNRTRADASYQSRIDYARASLSRSTENYVGSVGYAINVQNNSSGSSADGVLDYIGNRFDARVSVGTEGNNFGDITSRQTARLQVGTSLAFADGAFGIGRPIQDSFLLARAHPTLDTDVIVGRGLRGGKYEASSGILGAAVLSRISSYNPQDVQYDLKDGQTGYDIGSGVLRLHPTYRSGYDYVVGSDRFVSAVGTLQVNGTPAALMVGTITSTDDAGFEQQPFFTNSAGRFGIIGLAPGRTYTVQLNNGPAFEIRVPTDNNGLYRLETINLQNGSE